MGELDVATSDDEVVRAGDARDRGKENSVGTQGHGELTGGGHEVPRTDAERQARADDGTTSDIDEFWQHRSHISTS